MSRRYIQPSPFSTGDGVWTLRIKLPNGKQVTRRFREETSVLQLYAFAEHAASSELTSDDVILRSSIPGGSHIERADIPLNASSVTDRSALVLEEVAPAK